MIKLYKSDNIGVWLIEDTCLDIITQSDIGGTKVDAINSFTDYLNVYLLSCLNRGELERVLEEQK